MTYIDGSHQLSIKQTPLMAGLSSTELFEMSKERAREGPDP